MSFHMAYTCVENLLLQILSYILHISFLNKIFLYMYNIQKRGKLYWYSTKLVNIFKNYHDIIIRNLIKLCVCVLYVDYFSNHYVKLPLNFLSQTRLCYAM